MFRPQDIDTGESFKRQTTLAIAGPTPEGEPPIDAPASNFASQF